MKPACSYAATHAASLADPASFWMAQAGHLHWDREPTEPLSQDANGAYRWFRGGELNTAFLCLDEQVRQGRSGLPTESPSSLSAPKRKDKHHRH